MQACVDLLLFNDQGEHLDYYCHVWEGELEARQSILLLKG